MIEGRIISYLKDIAGRDNVFEDASTLDIYSRDETPGLKGRAEVVVKVKEKSEIVEILKMANLERIPVTPRGGGTGLSGGAVPIKGGIVLSLEKMDRIIDIDKVYRVVKLEPGVINVVLQRVVERYGLFYPVNPSSQDSCTIGGNVATGAGGANAVRYGTTRNYVTGIEAILPEGMQLSAGGSIFKNATDYDLIAFMLGSEGIFGIITEIVLRLIPMPLYQAYLIIPFKKFEDSLNAVSKLWERRFCLTMLEIVDGLTLRTLRDFLNMDIQYLNSFAHLILRLDEDREEDLHRLYEKIGRVCLDEGARDVLIADSPLNIRKVQDMRKNIHEAFVHYGLLADEDVVVPVRRVAELISGITEIGARYNTEVSFFGHLGDGNIHVNFLKKGMDKAESCVPSELLQELFSLVSKLKGKVSGEHGIGIIKRPYLSFTVDPLYIELKRKVKDIFDPHHIMNPGKII